MRSPRAAAVGALAGLVILHEHLTGQQWLAIAAIVAAYKGMNAAGGPKGVGDAVNESVVITFLLLFLANLIITAVYLQIVPPKGS